MEIAVLVDEWGNGELSQLDVFSDVARIIAAYPRVSTIEQILHSLPAELEADKDLCAGVEEYLRSLASSDEWISIGHCAPRSEENKQTLREVLRAWVSQREAV